MRQYDPETSSADDLSFTSAPQVMLAFYKYQWSHSKADDIRRRDAFHRLQVCVLSAFTLCAIINQLAVSYVC